MDLPSLVIGAVANGIVDQIVHDLAKRRQFRPIHQWLSGQNVRLPFEGALTQAVLTTALKDGRNRNPLLDWRCLGPVQVASALGTAAGAWGDASAARNTLAFLWLGLYPGGIRIEQRLEDLTSVFVEEFRRHLSQDGVVGSILWGQMPEKATTVIPDWHPIPGDRERYRHQISLALRRIPFFWRDMTLPNESAEIAAELPFVIRVDLQEARTESGLPVAIYPGEKAILLVNGRNVAAPLGPGAYDLLDLKEIRKQYVGRDKRLEAVIYQTDNLFVTYPGLEARLREDERVLISCRLRFTISNIVAFQAELVKRSQIYSISHLRERLNESVEAAVRQFLKDKSFDEVESSQQATEQLEVALEQELLRPVHGLEKAGVKFEGLISWRAISPAVMAGRSVKDPLEEQHRALEEERAGLRRLMKVWQDVQELRNMVGCAVGASEGPLERPAPTETTECLPWRYPPAGATWSMSPIRSRVLVHDQSVYMAELDGIVHCLDLLTGKSREGWVPPKLPDEVYGNLTLIERGPGAPALLVPCTDGKLYALQPETGTTLNVYLTGGRLRSAPLVSSGWVYLGCVAQGKWGGVVGLRLGDGKEMGRWQSPLPRGVLGTPVLDDQSHTVFFATLDEGGNTVYRASTARSGDAQLMFRTSGPVRASLVLDARRQRIYVASYRGVIHALTMDGAELWSRSLEGAVNAAGALADDVLYVGTEGGVIYGLDLNNKGADIWPPFRARGAVMATPIIHDDLLLFGSRDGNVYAINTATGGLCGEISTGSEVLAPLVFTKNDSLLIGCGGQKGGLLKAMLASLSEVA